MMNKETQILGSSPRMTTHKNTCALCGGGAFRFMFHHRYGWTMQKCSSCKLVQVMPRPTPQEIAKLYHEDMEHFTPYIEQIPVHREYFKKKIQEIRHVVIPASEPGSSVRQKRIPGQARNDRRLRLLDVGCAMGVLLKEAQKQGFAAEGVDISRDAVTYCKTHGLTAYAGTLGTVKNVKPNTYDVVTAFEVIEHEQDPLGMAKKAYALLKKGGVFVAGTPDHAGWWRVVMGKYWFGYQHPEHIVLFDPDTITKLLKKAGFTDIEVKRDPGRHFPLHFAFRRLADYFPVFRWILMPMRNLVKRWNLVNPINPWDDMIVYAKK